jgi:hypothetical protein
VYSVSPCSSAEMGRVTHLLDVGEHPPALENRREDGGKVVVREHDVTRVLGDVGSCTHSDTNIGSLERRRVVDSISG